MIEYIGFLGGLASILAFFLPATNRPQRVIHSVYVFIIVCVSTVGYAYQSKLQRIESAERAATVIIDTRSSHYTTDGFNMAALTFLEKYQDLYPETYSRALKLCENNGCLGNQYVDGTSSYKHAMSQIEVASSLAGMLRGISVLSTEN